MISTFKRQQVLLSVLVMSGIVFGGVGYAVYAKGQQRSTAQLIQTVMSKCGRFPSHSWAACSEKAIQYSIRYNSAADILHAMEKMPKNQCHISGHIVGKVLLQTMGSIDLAFAQCTSDCSHACAHGIVETLFLQKTSYEDSSLFSDSLELIRDKGKEYCDKYSEFCHGVGHAIYTNTGNKLQEALQICDSLHTTHQMACYGGVFMADDFAVLDEFSDTHIKLPKNVESMDLIAPCDAVSSRYQPGCFEYLHMRLNAIFNEMGLPRVVQDRLEFKACRMAPAGRARNACMFGAGVEMAPKESPEVAYKLCMDQEGLHDKESCVEGYAHRMGLYEREVDAQLFCQRLTPDSVKRSCYDGLFYSYKAFNANQDVASACDAVLDPICAQTLSDFMKGIVHAPRDNTLSEIH